MVRLEFLTDPAAVLERAGGRLAADPVVGTVVASVTARLRDEAAAGILPDPAVPRWWLLVTDDEGEVVGVGMRTATAPPYALFLLPMPEPAAVALARELVGRGEAATQFNGALPAVRWCSDEMARLVGGHVSVVQHTRLFELGRLVPPGPVPVLAGSVRMEQVAVNLILNALDAVEGLPGATVRVSLEGGEGGLLRLVVSDTGTNLPSWPVNCAATNIGCEKNFWILRAR